MNDGHPPSLKDLTNLSPHPEEVIKTLADKDMITINEKLEVTGAYPFTVEERVHRLTINGHNLHAMCALDALAPAAMFHCKSSIDSFCALTKSPVHIVLENKTIINDDARDFYFGINWQAACSSQSCASSLCTEMIFLLNKTIAEQWLNENPEQRQIFTLPEAIEFSAAFFVPLMQ
ncbi:MAG: organomercurial lyase [Gammaproteobacteria bacterium]